jgi:N-acyl-D-glutamate deacylase
VDARADRGDGGGEPDGTLEGFQRAFSLSNWQIMLATPEGLERILDRVDAGLRGGGIGIGIEAGYAPGYGRKEY